MPNMINNEISIIKTERSLNKTEMRSTCKLYGFQSKKIFRKNRDSISKYDRITLKHGKLPTPYFTARNFSVYFHN